MSVSCCLQSSFTREFNLQGRRNDTMIKEMIGLLMAPLFVWGAQPEKSATPESKFALSINNEVVPHAGPLRVNGEPDAFIVDLRPLQGMKLGNLNAWYVGVSGKAPEFDKINFVENLGDLWQRKLARGVTPATQKSYQEVVARYQASDRGLTTLPEFVAEADNEIKTVNAALDYDALCSTWDERVRKSSAKEKHYLYGGGCSLLKDMASQISGRDLVAYGMTELLPSREGMVNARLMEVLLQNAGSEYLNSLPALGDPMLSFGFYQFTSNAIRHDADGAQGASMINLYVDKSAQLTTGSVIGLKGVEHHRAAFMFAVYNIANWIRFSTPEERDELRQLLPSHMDQVAQFMAVAHHLPAPAINRARHWVQGGGEKPLVSYLGPSLTIYANKTKTNRAALDTVLD